MREIALTAMVLIAGTTSNYAQSLDQQERCAQQSFRFYQKEFGFVQSDPTREGYYQSHYNTKLGKCLVWVKIQNIEKAELDASFLVDANELREYAFYFEHGRCVLKPSLRQEIACTSREFYAFIASYMEE
jgi:hypothetical protein